MLILDHYETESLTKKVSAALKDQGGRRMAVKADNSYGLCLHVIALGRVKLKANCKTVFRNKGRASHVFCCILCVLGVEENGTAHG